MALEKLSLTLNPSGEGYEYEVSMIQEVKLRSRKSAFSIAPPGLAAAENILLGVSGMQADLEVRFMVHDDGSDKARGTYTSTVVTVEDQLEYLEDVIHAPDFDAGWTLDHKTGEAFSNDEVYLESIDVPLISRGSPKWKECRMALRRGSSV